MNPTHITSRHNAAVKHLKALSLDVRARQAAGQTVLDGLHLLEAALDSGITPAAVWLTEQVLSSCPQVSCPVFVLPDALLQSVAPTDHASGILAVVDVPPSPAVDARGTVMLLDTVQDPGNVGTLLRTAAAAGLEQVWLTPGCAAAWSPRVLRAGMGAHFSIALVEGVKADAVSLPGAVFATTLDAADSIFAADLRGPCVWLFGSEGAGLSAVWRDRATKTLHIPMPGRIESLNVAAAAAVCLFEQVRQRGGRSGA